MRGMDRGQIKNTQEASRSSTGLKNSWLENDNRFHVTHARIWTLPLNLRVSSKFFNDRSKEKTEVTFFCRWTGAQPAWKVRSLWFEGRENMNLGRRAGRNDSATEAGLHTDWMYGEVRRKLQSSLLQFWFKHVTRRNDAHEQKKRRFVLKWWFHLDCRKSGVVTGLVNLAPWV